MSGKHGSTSTETSGTSETTGAQGGQPAAGTGPLGSRLGNGSLASAAGTESLQERSNDAQSSAGSDETEPAEYFVVTDAGLHLPVHVDALGHAVVDDPEPPVSPQ